VRGREGGREGLRKSTKNLIRINHFKFGILPKYKKKTVLKPRRRYWAEFYIDDQPDDNDDKTRLLALRT
jgi:hypothetical protein